jgi:hypothetical protein
MRTLVILTALTLALAAAGAARAGGFATVGVSPQPPDEAGAIWRANLNIRQHGRTPLDGVQPVITIRNDATGDTKTFVATPTGEPGIYAARVVFPAAGTWRYEINDGFTPWTHTFAPLTVGGTGGGSAFPVWTLVLAAGLALGLGAALAAVLRQRAGPELTPAPSR